MSAAYPHRNGSIARRWAQELNELLQAVAGRVLLTPALVPYLAELPDNLPGPKDLQRLLSALKAAPSEALANPVRLQTYLLDAGAVEDRLLDRLREAAADIPAPLSHHGQPDATVLLDAIRRIRHLGEQLLRFEVARKGAARLLTEFWDSEAISEILAELEPLKQPGAEAPRGVPCLGALPTGSRRRARSRSG